MTSVLSNRNLALATAALLAVVLTAMARGIGQFPALSMLVQVHLLSMTVVMLLTCVRLAQPKGTTGHRRLGRIWAALMWGNALLTLFFNAGYSRSCGVFAGDISCVHGLACSWR